MHFHSFIGATPRDIQEVTFHGAKSGDKFSFAENKVLMRGRSGFFGVVRFGTHYDNNGDNNGQQVVIKELVPARNRSLVLENVAYSQQFLERCSVLHDTRTSATDTAGVSLTEDNVAILRAPNGLVLAAARKADGSLRSMTLSEYHKIFGYDVLSDYHYGDDVDVDKDKDSDDSLVVPQVWKEFVAHRRRVRKEIDAMAALPSHPNLINMIDHGEVIDGNKLRTFLVLPYFKNGDLMDKLNAQTITEDQQAKYFGQIVAGVEAMHNDGWAHRDLKLDNILVADDNETLVIADMGFATRLIDSRTGLPRRNHNKVGSHLIRAPEVWEHGDDLATMSPGSTLHAGYDAAKADVWSLGIILFNLRTRTDFWVFINGQRWAKMRSAAPNDAAFQALQRGNIRTAPAFVGDSKDLLLSLLELAPETRITASAVMDHPWVAPAVANGSVVRSKSSHSEKQAMAASVIDDLIEDAHSSLST